MKFLLTLVHLFVYLVKYSKAEGAKKEPEAEKLELEEANNNPGMFDQDF